MLPRWLSRKESACQAEDAGSIPGSGRSPGEGLETHSSFLAWEIPWTEEPGRLQSMGLQKDKTWRLNNNRDSYSKSGNNLGYNMKKIQFSGFVLNEVKIAQLCPYNGRRTWQPTPVFLPGKFHGWRSLVGYSPWGRKESEPLGNAALGALFA